MIDNIKAFIAGATGADTVYEIEVIQNLWSGYGNIVRYGLTGSHLRSVVVKHVDMTEQGRHPRGWNTDISHQRKMRSYQVEMAWYQQWNQYCNDACRVPACLAAESSGNQSLMVLEDLDGAGFPERKISLSICELTTCLEWLANFHVTFLGEQPRDLWPTGTYWHLETRPDEWKALCDMPLKSAAEAIDRQLSHSPFQTFVHGDAKLANFCFSKDGSKVAAVDFQYVGGGCGIKDVAYFISSCLDEVDCQRLETQLLDVYFQALKSALVSKQKKIDAEALEQNWRALYPVAWTDFYRFLKGWSPEHWKIHAYSERLAREVVMKLTQMQ